MLIVIATLLTLSLFALALTMSGAVSRGRSVYVSAGESAAVRSLSSSILGTLGCATIVACPAPVSVDAMTRPELVAFLAASGVDMPDAETTGCLRMAAMMIA